jgi:hypothetical protein
MHPADLETTVDEGLRQLLAPKAPPTLLPRVMAVVAEWAARPWYTRAWFTWPAAWQAASIALLIVLIAGGALLQTRLQEALQGTAASGAAAGVTARVAGVAHGAEAVARAATVLWHALFEPVATYAAALVVMMSLACAVVGAALNRVVVGGAWTP